MSQFKTTITSGGKQQMIYVYYSGENPNRVLKDVCLAGDLMSIKDKLDTRQLNRIEAKIRNH